jgi:hypothetical protein
LEFIFIIINIILEWKGVSWWKGTLPEPLLKASSKITENNITRGNTMQGTSQQETDKEKLKKKGTIQEESEKGFDSGGGVGGAGSSGTGTGRLETTESSESSSK